MNIAYQVVGDGPLDLVWVMGWVSNVDYFWQEPSFARFLRRLASFSRVILFDKRGTGMSDRVPIDALPTLEQRMDDVRAVMDAVGSERAALVGLLRGRPAVPPLRSDLSGAHCRDGDHRRIRAEIVGRRLPVRPTAGRLRHVPRDRSARSGEDPSASGRALPPLRTTSASARGGRRTSA